jgi:hypothetical protein
MIQIIAQYIGYVVMCFSGMAFAITLAWIVIDPYGKFILNKLQAAYDWTVLHYHLRDLEAQGRLLRKSKREE